MQQEGQIANMENRNYYSLHCLQMETQLVYAHLDIFYDVLSRMAEVEAHANAQVSVVSHWGKMMVSLKENMFVLIWNRSDLIIVCNIWLEANCFSIEGRFGHMVKALDSPSGSNRFEPQTSLQTLPYIQGGEFSIWSCGWDEQHGVMCVLNTCRPERFNDGYPGKSEW